MSHASEWTEKEEEDKTYQTFISFVAGGSFPAISCPISTHPSQECVSIHLFVSLLLGGGGGGVGGTEGWAIKLQVK